MAKVPRKLRKKQKDRFKEFQRDWSKLLDYWHKSMSKERFG